MMNTGVRWTLILFALVVFANSTVHADEEEVEKAIVGEWTIVLRELNGKNAERYVGATFVRTESAKTFIKNAEGKQEPIRIAMRLYDVPSKLFRFTIEAIDDDPSVGGGGPRKGICRINDKGELEILETRSAAYDYPDDFTDEAKKQCYFWKLTKK